MKRWPLDELAEILGLMALAEQRAGAAENRHVDTFLRLAREQLMAAANRASGRGRRPDGSLQVHWAAAQIVVMGGVAFGCAYGAGALLELPSWVTALIVITGQLSLSLVWLAVTRRLGGRARSKALRPGWPDDWSGVDAMANGDVAALLIRARNLIGRLAAQRLGLTSSSSLSGDAAHWIGAHDRFLLNLHHADAHLRGTGLAWTNPSAGRERTSTMDDNSAATLAAHARKLSARAEAVVWTLQIRGWSRPGSTRDDRVLVAIHQTAMHLRSAADTLDRPGLTTYMPPLSRRMSVISPASMLGGIVLAGLFLHGSALVGVVIILAMLMGAVPVVYRSWALQHPPRSRHAEPDLVTFTTDLTTEVGGLLEALQPDRSPLGAQARAAVQAATLWTQVATQSAASQAAIATP